MKFGCKFWQERFCKIQEQQQRDAAMTARIRKEQDDNMNEMDRARELLKMKTVKIQQAAAPEVCTISLEAVPVLTC